MQALLGMRWEQAAFVHWPVPEEAVRPLVPAGLDIDLHEGRAWVSLVAFRLAGARMAGIPFSAAFAEVNLRTYVRRAGVPGIWFLGLDAQAHLFPRLARLYRLPYRRATIDMDERGLHGRPRGADPYRLSWHRGAPHEPDALDQFLVERYEAFGGQSRLWQAHVAHEPWFLYELKVRVEGAGALAPWALSSPARAHYSPGVHVHSAMPRRVRRRGAPQGGAPPCPPTLRGASPAGEPANAAPPRGHAPPS
ncbi:MAG: YqjF family protein [Thermoplasmatota archaeon]